MTNPAVAETIAALRAYAKDQGGWHNIDDTCDAAAAHLERLQAENDRLREALKLSSCNCESSGGTHCFTTGVPMILAKGRCKSQIAAASLAQEEGR